MAEQSVPVFELEPPTDELAPILRDLQALVLKHPVAAQAAYRGLIEEGRRFVATAEGARWRGRLVGSELLDRVRLVFESSSLWILEEDSPAILPSAYLDALFLAASHRDMEPLLDELFPSDGEEEGDA